MDNVFANLIDKIASTPDEDIDKFEQSYNDLLEGMTNNVELITEVKHSCRASGMTLTDVQSDKESMYTLTEHLIKAENFGEKKAKLLRQMTEITAAIYDKVMEDYYRDIANVPVELCREGAKLPTYAHDDDAGFDIYLPEGVTIESHKTGVIVPTGLKMAIPTGYELQIRPRSGNSVKTTLRIANAPGTIDCGYCDEIGVICDNIGDEPLTFKAGDRIAQGVLQVVPKGKFIQVEDITKIAGSNRGGGYGSSGQ